MRESLTIGLLDRPRTAWYSPRRWLAAIASDLSALWECRFVITNLASARLKVRYQRSALGMFWAVLTPILMLAVLSVVFGHVIGRKVERFPVYLFTGLVPFKFFGACLQVGSCSLTSGHRILTRFRIRPLVLPIVDVLVASFNLTFEMVALFLVVIVAGSFEPIVQAKLSASIVVLPVGIVLLAMFSTGVILISMTLVTYFRDVEHVISVVTRALYFISGVIIPPTAMGRASILVYANPLWHHLQFFRCSLWMGTWPSATTWLVASGSAVGALLLGYVVYKRYEHDYIFRI